MPPARPKISAQKRHWARLARVHSSSFLSELLNFCDQVITELVALKLDRIHSVATQQADSSRRRYTTLDQILN